MVTIDSLRADHCGFLGGQYKTTPMLDSMADDSIIFENAIAPGPRTPSSMPVIFTGETINPRYKGIYSNYSEKTAQWKERRKRIRQHLTRYHTIGERLQDAGYDTAAVTSNPWTAQDTGFDRGFDQFYSIEGAEKEGMSVGRLGRITLKRLFGSRWESWFLKWPDYYSTVIGAVRQLEEPYFLWVFLLEPHRPYLAPKGYRVESSSLSMYHSNFWYGYMYRHNDVLPPYLDENLKKSYRDAVRSADGFVKNLQRDLTDHDPVFAVHADHGEAFLEHGTRGHRPQLYTENIHVPFLIHNVGRSERIKQPVSMRRLPEALSQIAQADASFDPDSITSDVIISRTEEDERVSIRSEEWAHTTDAKGWDYVSGSEEELYHLPTDPMELNNVLDQLPDERRSLRMILDNYEEHGRERARISNAAESLLADD